MLEGIDLSDAERSVYIRAISEQDGAFLFCYQPVGSGNIMF